MIGVIHRSGSMRSLVASIAPWATTRRAGQLLTWMLGLLIFIDDYANTLLLGHTMRPLADRLQISREKLAYLVDSTAAPVAGLAIISTWVAGEIGYIDAGFDSLSLPAGSVDGFAVFVATIPYRFYVLLALLFVPMVGLSGRDFGPMLTAERERMKRPSNESDPVEVRHPGPDDSASGSWWGAIVPVLATLLVTVCLLWVTGQREVAEEVTRRNSWRTWVQIVGAGDSYLALVYGSLVGLIIAVVLAQVQGVLSWADSQQASLQGATMVLPAMLILWLAWTLSGITGKEFLGTGEFLGSQLQQTIDVRFMPTIVFLVASFVAFSTGTSWGTMGILMPIVVGATYRMLQTQLGVDDPYAPLMSASIGSVLAGAIFGDHCSPISDTTVLSSQASGCNHMSHVWTQLPYALVVAVVAVLLGTLPVGFGVPPVPLLMLGMLALWGVVRFCGRRVED